MATSLDRDDIIGGLRELIAELRAANEVAGIRLVGGAALALRYFDRGTTQDLDSLHIQPGSDEAVAAAAARVAAAHGWDPTWLNLHAGMKRPGSEWHLVAAGAFTSRASVLPARTRERRALH